MTKKTKAIPKWLCWRDGREPPSPDEAHRAREEFYRALQLYHDHVRHVVYIMLSVPGGVLIALSAQSDGDVKLLGGTLLTVLPALLGGLSIGVLRRYYEVYVAALLFAVRLACARDEHENHSWLERTLNQARESGVDSAQEFVTWRASQPGETYVGYRRIIVAIACGSCLGGAFLLLLQLRP